MAMEKRHVASRASLYTMSEESNLLGLLASASLLAVLIGVAAALPSDETILLQDGQLALVANIDKSAVRKWQQRKFLQNDLSLGSRGEEVFLVQKALSTDLALYPVARATGYFGIETKEALKRFQKLYGLPVSGAVEVRTRAKLDEIYFNELCPKPVREYPDFTFADLANGNSLPEGYTPPDLVDISERMPTTGRTCLRREAAVFLEWMMADAAKAGIHLGVVSAYRQEAIQEIIVGDRRQKVNALGHPEVARQGASEHQLGTAVDLTGRTRGYETLSEAFGASAEGRWLQKNAHLYGFIMSYPKGKESITGYAYEPWHWRYVGSKAGEIWKQGITLAEFKE